MRAEVRAKIVESWGEGSEAIQIYDYLFGLYSSGQTIVSFQDLARFIHTKRKDEKYRSFQDISAIFFLGGAIDVLSVKAYIIYYCNTEDTYKRHYISLNLLGLWLREKSTCFYIEELDMEVKNVCESVYLELEINTDKFGNPLIL